MPAETEEIGVVLKALRMHLGLSQQEFARRLGWSAQRISYMETGKFAPSVRSLLLIGSVTGVPAWKLIRNVERRKKLLSSHQK